MLEKEAEKIEIKCNLLDRIKDNSGIDKGSEFFCLCPEENCYYLRTRIINGKKIYFCRYEAEVWPE
jgi:hypothetical protein